MKFMFRKSSPNSGAAKWWPTILGMALLACAVALTFHEALGFGFFCDWDDLTFTLQNPHISFNVNNLWYFFARPFQDLYTPLPMWSLMLDHAIFGADAFGYHLHNLLLHILAAWALFAVLLRLGAGTATATLCAMLWALNPQKAESVVWISERKDVLCGLLSFLAVWFFLERRYAWSALLTVLAIWAKPAAIPLPGIYMVYAWGKGEKLSRRETLVPTLAGLAATFFSMWMTSQTNPGTLEGNLLVPLHNLCWYPLTALVPFETNPIYPEVLRFDHRCALTMLAGSALLALGVWSGLRLGVSRRKVLAALMVVLGSMLPVLGLLHYTNFRYCDRYNYLVSAAVVAMLALLVERLLRRFPQKTIRKALTAALALAAVAYACCTYLYVPYWENDVRLSYYVLQQPGTPNLKAYELGIMAGFRLEATDFLEYLKRELPYRPPASDNNPQALVNNLLLFMEEHQLFLDGRYEEAERRFNQIAASSRTASEPGKGNWIALSPPLIQWLYEDQAEIARRQGDEKKAAFYQQAKKIH